MYNYTSKASGARYSLHTLPVNLYQAEATCVADGGHVVSYTSIGEHLEAERGFAVMGATHYGWRRTYWIGLHIPQVGWGGCCGVCSAAAVVVMVVVTWWHAARAGLTSTSWSQLLHTRAAAGGPQPLAALFVAGRLPLTSGERHWRRLQPLGQPGAA